MADKTRGRYNLGFLLIILDLLMLIVLFSGATYYHFNTRGVVTIAESEQKRLGSLTEYRNEIARYSQTIAESEDERQETILRRNAFIEQAKQIDERIKREHEEIQGLKKRDQTLTDEFVSLRRDIDRTDDQRRSKQAEILERREEINSLEARVAALRAEISDSLGHRDGIEANIAAVRRQRQRDPIGVFPPNAAVASVVEMANADQVFSVSVSGVVKSFGDINVGLAGNLGLARESASSVKEGGVFANIPLAFRRASVDLETGLASLRGPSGNDDLAGFAGATVRYAPLRKERFFLLAGTKYRQDELSLRLGLGFGRR